MNHSSKRSATVAVGLAALLASAVAAAAPDDNWYAGGKSNARLPETISETWHMKTPNPDGHVVLFPHTITLQRLGGKDNFVLIPDAALGWTPKVINLNDHPDWTASPGSDGWRWVSAPSVKIGTGDNHTNRHEHKICVGYPFESGDKGAEEIYVGVVDASLECDVIEDRTEEHAGHTAVGR